MPPKCHLCGFHHSNKENCSDFNSQKKESPVARLCHDINNQLQVLQPFSELIANSNDLDKIKMYNEKIKLATNNIESIVKEINRSLL